MRVLVILVLEFVLVLAVAGCGGPRAEKTAKSMTVSSAAFDDGERIPLEHTCEGEDVAPPLSWEAPPAEAAEIVVVVDDPDAPGGEFIHWLVAGLAPEMATLAGPLPAGAVEGRNDFDRLGWAGPCPPPGDGPHTYRFRVRAVAEETGLGRGFSPVDLEEAIGGRLVAEGAHHGTYER